MTHYYFKQLENENTTKFTDTLSPAEYDELKTLAKKEYNEQDIRNKPNFDDSTCFISSSDLHGFYFVNAKPTDKTTGYPLKLIAFKNIYTYNIKEYQRTFEGRQAIAIYTDSNENYLREKSALDVRPLERWQTKIQNNIDEYGAKIDALKQIQRIYKKDGKPFQRIQQNFTNCTVTEKYSIYGEFLGYNVAYYYTDKYTKPATIYGTSKYQIKTVDDVIPAIENYIKDFDGYIKENQRLLTFSTVIYNEVMGDIHKSILKYQTPSNNFNITIDYFKHTVEEWLKDCYLNI